MQSTSPNTCLSRELCQPPTAPGLAGRARGSPCPAGHGCAGAGLGIPGKAGIPEVPSHPFGSTVLHRPCWGGIYILRSLQRSKDNLTSILGLRAKGCVSNPLIR